MKEKRKAQQKKQQSIVGNKCDHAAVIDLVDMQQQDAVMDKLKQKEMEMKIELLKRQQAREDHLMQMEERKQAMMEMEFHQNICFREMEMKQKHKLQNRQYQLSHNTAVMNQRLLMKEDNPNVSSSAMSTMFPIIDLSRPLQSQQMPDEQDERIGRSDKFCKFNVEILGSDDDGDDKDNNNN